LTEWIALTEYNWVLWVAGLFALLNFGKWLYEIGATICEWLFTKKGVETKKMREKREWEDRLKKAEKDIEEIKNTSKHNVDMFLEHEKVVVAQFVGIRDEIVVELNKLHDKMDEQKDEMEKTNEANNKTDCAMLRDRIGSGMRYFSRNVGADGKVHISLSDYENMNALFQEYFAKHGNGAFKKMYDDEFTQFIIDR
jgi:hypothetical protein